MTVVPLEMRQENRRMRFRIPQGFAHWDTDTATAVLIVGALAYLVLVRAGFSDVVAP